MCLEVSLLIVSAYTSTYTATGDTEINIPAHTSARTYHVSVKTSATKAASTATDARSMVLKRTLAQFLPARATRLVSVENTTCGCTRIGDITVRLRAFAEYVLIRLEMLLSELLLSGEREM